VGLGDVLGPDGGGEAVHVFVAAGDDFVDVFEFDDGEDGAEEAGGDAAFETAQFVAGADEDVVDGGDAAAHGVGGQNLNEGVADEDGNVVREDTTGLFIFIGAKPRTDFLPPELARDDKGFVLTGPAVAKLASWKEQRLPEALETSLPGVFTSGDCRSGTTKRVAFAIGDGLLRHPFQVDRAKDRAIHRVDYRRIRRGVTENVHVLVKRIEQNGIRAALDVNGLDRLEGLRVPHHDGLTACEPVPGFRVDDDAVRRCVGDLARRLQRVKIKNGDPTRALAWNVQPAPLDVGEGGIECTFATDFYHFGNLVWPFCQSPLRQSGSKEDQNTGPT